MNEDSQMVKGDIKTLKTEAIFLSCIFGMSIGSGAAARPV